MTTQTPDAVREAVARETLAKQYDASMPSRAAHIRAGTSDHKAIDAILAFAALDSRAGSTAAKDRLVGKLRALGFDTHAENVAAGHAVLLPSYVTLDLLAEPPSYAAASEDVRERAQLLAEVELHLKSSRIFITTREKMHPCGVELHDELLGRVTAAIDSIGKAKGHD
ncbi:hypothetical protein V3I01_08250 [Sphingomonas sp. gentR]|uniref:hypothetical protein n=1 Tax=Sphingomonas sp. gentR TaxID=3118768 RepID=UPI0030CD7545